MLEQNGYLKLLKANHYKEKKPSLTTGKKEMK